MHPEQPEAGRDLCREPGRGIPCAGREPAGREQRGAAGPAGGQRGDRPGDADVAKKLVAGAVRQLGHPGRRPGPVQHHRNGPVPVGESRRKPRRGRQNSGWAGGPGQPEFCGDAGSSQLCHGDAGSSCLTGSDRSDLSERCGVVGSGFGGICGRDVLRRGQRCHGQGCGDPGGS